MGLSKLIPLLVLIVLCSGCINLKTYVPPAEDPDSLSAIIGDNSGPSIGVLVDFQRQGEDFPEAQKQARESVFRTLKEVKIFKHVLSGTFGSDAIVTVVINNTDEITPSDYNIIDLQSHLLPNDIGITDEYLISLNYQSVADPDIKVSSIYKHSIISTISGNEAPYNLQPTPVEQVFEKVIDDVVRSFLLDLEKQGIIQISK